MRRFIIILSIAIGLAGHSSGQEFVRMNLVQPVALTASAGHDTLVCLSHPVILGGNPSADGGNRRYVYLWSPQEGLDDPTSPNPTAILNESKSYTLSVTDGQGCQAVSYVNVSIDACLGTNEQNLNQVISVFPNPSGGVFTISGIGSSTGQLQTIEVLNDLGQNLFTRKYQSGDLVSDIIIDTHINDPGIYFLKITQSNRVVSKRLIIR
jgi:hypothetical protein